MILSLVRATDAWTPIRKLLIADEGDRVTSDGVWSLTHELADEDEIGESRTVVVATHLASGLQLTHALAGVDDWLMSGVALAELKALAVATLNGIAVDEEKTAARAVLVMLGVLRPAAAAEQVESRCECGGFLALAAGGRLVHVDVCLGDIEALGLVDGPDLCEASEHRICLEPAARRCGHSLCRARGCVYAPPCEVGYDDCCGPCCHGDRD